MWGLVVGIILPGYTHSIGVVVHKTGHTVGSPVASGEDVDGAGVGGIPKDEFLAPVAKDVGL